MSNYPPRPPKEFSLGCYIKVPEDVFNKFSREVQLYQEQVDPRAGRAEVGAALITFALSSPDALINKPAASAAPYARSDDWEKQKDIEAEGQRALSAWPDARK